MTPAAGVNLVFGAVVRPIQAFLRLEAASGILLLAAAVAALTWTNVDGETYRSLVDYPLALGAGGAIAPFTLGDLVNDGLMTLFFFVVGMEIKRELAIGELDTVRKALLPGIAAIGGMVVPSAIFLALNRDAPGRNGWGIPMATDIAFCVGVLTLLQKRVPRALVIFVTALAIFDDIGGILVIALFYGHGLNGPWLLIAAGVTLVLWVFNRRYVRNGLAYFAAGGALWYALHHGGVHATIAGVVTGLMIPARPPRPSRDVIRELAEHASLLDRRARDEELDNAEILMIEEKLEELEAPLQRFIHWLHPYVAFFVMPVFALVNSGVSLRGSGPETFIAPVALGTALGLFVGKQVGIFGFTVLAVKLGLSPMPGGSSRGQLYGVSMVAGIGFTVALFIATLAYPATPALLAEAKIGILVGSLAAGVLGALVIALSSAPSKTSESASPLPEARPPLEPISEQRAP